MTELLASLRDGDGHIKVEGFERDVRPVSEAEREAFRQDGRRLVASLIAYLDSDAADARRRRRLEARAGAVVDDQAVRLADRGATLTDAVSLFVDARQPFLELGAGDSRPALDFRPQVDWRAPRNLR